MTQELKTDVKITKDCEYEDDPAKCHIAESPVFRTAVQPDRHSLACSTRRNGATRQYATTSSFLSMLC